MSDDGEKLVPDGWTARGWLERLTYMIGVCAFPERKRELEAMKAKIEKRENAKMGRRRGGDG